jgi:predicted nucleic acid-binding protein
VTKTGLDTSYLVALLSGWHEYHDATIADFESRRRHTHFIVAAQALLETYSVLTRMPAPYRLSPRQTAHLLVRNFRESVSCAALDPADCWSAVQELADGAIAGGRTQDAIIARCCARAGAGSLLTWTPRDFAAVAPPGLRIVEPAA